MLRVVLSYLQIFVKKTLRDDDDDACVELIYLAMQISSRDLTKKKLHCQILILFWLVLFYCENFILSLARDSFLLP